MGKRFKQTLDKRHMKNKEALKRVPQTIKYQENENEYTMRYYYVPTGIPKLKRLTTSKCQWGCGTTELLYTASKVVNGITTFGELFTVVF